MYKFFHFRSSVTLPILHCMPAADTAPATKRDIAMLMEQMGQYYDKIEQRMEDMREEMQMWKQELKDHFDVVAENIKHDFLHGTLHDKIEQHEDRLVRLEEHVGIAT